MTEAKTALARVEPHQTPGALATIMGVPPKQMMTYALEVADTLTAVLRDRKMTKNFGGPRDHVQTEGWQFAGSLMGFTVDEVGATELPDGSFEAVVQLKSIHSGAVLAKASARCGTDEPNWRSKPKFSRRSMAFTRAIGRAYAQNFRWLIQLAGFEGTPAEEMEGIGKKEVRRDDDEKKGFDPEDPQHRGWLSRTLAAKKLPEEEWAPIAERFKGMPADQLQHVIDAYHIETGRL